MPGFKRRRLSWGPTSTAAKVGAAVAGRVVGQVAKRFGSMGTMTEAAESAPKETSRYRAVRTSRPRKRRVSKRKIRFAKAVKEILAGEDATQHLQRFNVSNSLYAWAVSQQTDFDITIFGGAGAGGSHDDLLQMIQLSFGTAIDEESFIEVKGAHMHYTLRNDQVGKIIDIDSYELICIKDVPLGAGSSVAAMYRTSISEQGTTGVGTATQLVNTTPGVNPYTVAGTFLQYWKIQKKQKIYLPPGEAIDGEMSLHFKHKKVMGKEVLDNTALLAKAGVTKSKLFIVNNLDWSVSEAGLGLRLNFTKSLTYKAQDIKTRGAGLV